MKTRFLALILSVLLIGACTACGFVESGTDPEPNPPQTETPNPNPNPNPPPPPVLTVTEQELQSGIEAFYETTDSGSFIVDFTLKQREYFNITATELAEWLAENEGLYDEELSHYIVGKNFEEEVESYRLSVESGSKLKAEYANYWTINGNEIFDERFESMFYVEMKDEKLYRIEHSNNSTEFSAYECQFSDLYDYEYIITSFGELSLSYIDSLLAGADITSWSDEARPGESLFLNEIEYDQLIYNDGKYYFNDELKAAYNERFETLDDSWNQRIENMYISFKNKKLSDWYIEIIEPYLSDESEGYMQLARIQFSYGNVTVDIPEYTVETQDPGTNPSPTTTTVTEQELQSAIEAMYYSPTSFVIDVFDISRYYYYMTEKELAEEIEWLEETEWEEWEEWDYEMYAEFISYYVVGQNFEEDVSHRRFAVESGAKAKTVHDEEYFTLNGKGRFKSTGNLASDNTGYAEFKDGALYEIYYQNDSAKWVAMETWFPEKFGISTFGSFFFEEPGISLRYIDYDQLTYIDGKYYFSDELKAVYIDRGLAFAGGHDHILDMYIAFENKQISEFYVNVCGHYTEEECDPLEPESRTWYYQFSYGNVTVDIPPYTVID